MCVACDVEVGVSFDGIGSFFFLLFLYAERAVAFFECVCFSFVLIVRFVFLYRYSCFPPGRSCLFVCLCVFLPLKHCDAFRAYSICYFTFFFFLQFAALFGLLLRFFFFFNYLLPLNSVFLSSDEEQKGKDKKARDFIFFLFFFFLSVVALSLEKKSRWSEN